MEILQNIITYVNILYFQQILWNLAQSTAVAGSQECIMGIWVKEINFMKKSGLGIYHAITSNKICTTGIWAGMWVHLFHDILYHFLTHRGRDKMAVISRTTLSNAFYWIKVLKFD